MPTSATSSLRPFVVLVCLSVALAAYGENDYKLAPAKTPKEIDVIPREGPPNEKGQTFPGIYELTHVAQSVVNT